MAEKRYILPWWDPDNTGEYRSVLWNLTRRCNKNCGYCPFHDKTSEVLADRQLILLARAITHQIDQACLHGKSKFNQVTLFGGEPTTIHIPTLITCVAILSTVPTQILLYTNMTAHPKHYFDLINAGVSTIMASYHAESNTGYIGVANKIKAIKEAGLSPHFNFLLMEDAYKLEYIQSCLYDAGIKYNVFKPHREGAKAHQPDKNTVVDVNGWKSLVHNNQNNFEGWECFAGYRHAYVECNGDVYPCQGIGHACYTGKLKREDWVKGNLLNDILVPFWTDSVKSCPVKACRFEVGITKCK